MNFLLGRYLFRGYVKLREGIWWGLYFNHQMTPGFKSIKETFGWVLVADVFIVIAPLGQKCEIRGNHGGFLRAMSLKIEDIYEDNPMPFWFLLFS